MSDTQSSQQHAKDRRHQPRPPVPAVLRILQPPFELPARVEGLSEDGATLSVDGVPDLVSPKVVLVVDCTRGGVPTQLEQPGAVLHFEPAWDGESRAGAFRLTIAFQPPLDVRDLTLGH